MNFKIMKRRLGFIVEPALSPIKNKAKKMLLTYARASKKPIKKKTILFEAYLGKSMTGNSYALFQEIYQDTRFKDFTFIWSLDSFDSIQVKYKSAKNVKFIKRESTAYPEALARSEYLVTDTTFPHYFNKRTDGQTYIMAWHGTPYKTIGKDIQHTPVGAHKNVMKNMLHTDYFISPSEFTTTTILNSQDAYDLFSGVVIETGMPRTDMMFGTDITKIKAQLNLPLDKKIVLYAPTWNDFIKNATVTGGQLATDVINLQKQLGSDYLVCLKAHYLEYNAIKEMTTAVTLIDNSIDTNELLSIADHLITDYSSIFFDYLPLQKPIHFYFKNYEEFENGRGFYLEQNELPGTKSHTIEELAAAILSESNSKPLHYEQEIKRFSPYDDGNVSKRIIDKAFFNIDLTVGSTYKTVTKKEKLLFYSGLFKNNGISESFIRMSNQLDYDKYHVTVVVPTNLKKNPGALYLLERLHPEITLLFPVGNRINATIQDQYGYKFFLNRGYNGITKKFNIPKIFNNEFHRLVGNVHYNKAIDFSGYSAYYGAVLGFSDADHKAVFMHSDMEKDKERVVKKKRPNRLNLQAMFSIYPYFDKLVSVSETSYQANLKKLGGKLRVTDKMTYVVNYLDAERISELEDQFSDFTIDGHTLLTDTVMDEDPQGVVIVKGIPEPRTTHTNYVTLGRLSPEKNQALLIKAFSKVVEEKPNSTLYIIGDGPQKNSLVNLVNSLQLADHVIFVGHMSNPFFLLKKCDIFVLTSSYEGQALVILEALAVGLKVISTDIPGPDNILKEGYGELVEATDIGLAKKMITVSDSSTTYKKFDAHAYDKKALMMFESMLEQLK